MKKLIYTVTAALIMLAFVSCEKKETVKEAQSSVEKADMVFTATSESGALKTTMHSNGTTVVWSEGDKIKVFTAEDQTGSVCTMTDPKWVGTNTAEFAGQCAKKGPWTAICPANKATGFANGNITITMPEKQTYAANTFAAGAMPCVAYSEIATLNFKHTFGVLKFSLQLKEGETGSVKSITVTTKGSEKLNGTFTVNPSSGSAAAQKSGADGTASVIIDCGTGVALSTSTATDFWIVVPQGAFEGGFDVTVTPIDDHYLPTTISATKANTITAGKIKEMPVQIVEFNEKPRPACQEALDADANWVKIGEQYWLKENIKCTEYDKGSEAYKVGRYTIPTSSDKTYNPYYTVIPDSKKPDHMTPEQFGKLGLLYNWAAAMGYTDLEARAQTGAYSGTRQGICPNGSHIPSVAEWNVLSDYLGGGSVAGKKMKTETGWYKNFGTNESGFAALPAGYAQGSTWYSGVGDGTYYLSSNAYQISSVYDRELGYGYEDLYPRHTSKEYACSVRCLRD